MPRPSLVAPVVRADREQVDADLDLGFAFGFRGKRLVVRIGDLSGIDEKALRTVHGCAFLGLMRQLGDEPGLDTLGAAVWLHERTTSDKPRSYDEVLSDVRWSDFDLDDVEVVEDGDEAPEA